MTDTAKNRSNADASGKVSAAKNSETIDQDLKNLVDLSMARFDAAVNRVSASNGRLRCAARDAKRSISGEMPALVPPKKAAP